MPTDPVPSDPLSQDRLPTEPMPIPSRSTSPARGSASEGSAPAGGALYRQGHGDHRYQFQYQETSVYARVMSLVTSLARPVPGLVLDIGCGFGAVAEPCREGGFGYAGFDVSEAGLTSLRQRGFEAYEADASNVASFAALIRQNVGNRPVAAILLLDVLEHLVNGDALITELSAFAMSAGSPILVMSVPNVTHFDLASKQLMGRFDVTPTGLLDETHVVFYTDRRLREVTRLAGWHEIGSNDHVMYESDQFFPPDAPHLAPGTPLNSFLRRLRELADDFAFVNQFVRAYAPASTEEVTAVGPDGGGAGSTAAAGVIGPVGGEPGEEAARMARVAAGEAGNPSQVFQARGAASPLTREQFNTRIFASVLVRTTGARMSTLHDTLLSLAAQTFKDFEVLLLCHNVRREDFDAIKELVDDFPAGFARQVRVVQVTGGGRSRPLNAGTSLATGRYCIILDDDDLAFGHWMQEFRELEQRWPGQVLRLGVAAQNLEDQPGPGESQCYHAIGRPRCPYPKTFDFFDHLYENQTPPCVLAYPTTLFQCVGIHFGEQWNVLEDWDVLLQAAELCGVATTPKVSALYRLWDAGNQSAHLHSQEEWLRTRAHMQEGLNSRSILMPPDFIQTVDKLSHMKTLFPDLHRERMRLLADNDNLKAELARLGALPGYGDGFEQQKAHLQPTTPIVPESVAGGTPESFGLRTWKEVAYLAAVETDRLKGSRSWTITSPLRRAGRIARRLRSLRAGQ